MAWVDFLIWKYYFLLAGNFFNSTIPAFTKKPIKNFLSRQNLCLGENKFCNLENQSQVCEVYQTSDLSISFQYAVASVIICRYHFFYSHQEIGFLNHICFLDK